VETRASRRVRLVEADDEALMPEAVDLRVTGLDDRLRVVAEVLAGESARGVEVLPPGGVPDRGALRGRDGEVGRRNAASHIPLSRGADGRRVLNLLRRHRLNLRPGGS